MRKRSEDVSTNSKICRSHMRTFFSAFEAKRNAAKIIDSHVRSRFVTILIDVEDLDCRS